MAAPLLPGFLKYFVYPATVTVISIMGNNYLLGAQIQDGKTDVRVQFEDMKAKFGEVKAEIKVDMKESPKELKTEFKEDTKEIKHDVRLLLSNQTALAAHGGVCCGKARYGEEKMKV